MRRMTIRAFDTRWLTARIRPSAFHSRGDNQAQFRTQPDRARDGEGAAEGDGAFSHRLQSKVARSRRAEFESAAKQTKLPAELKVTGSLVMYGNERIKLPAVGKFISASANPTTLALTFELTHAVILVTLK